MTLDRLSHEYIGDFARMVALDPPRVALALYDEPAQWRMTIEALEAELAFYGVGITHLECSSSAGARLVEGWVAALAHADPKDRLFVVDEVSMLRDDRFALLFRALEESRELVLSANKGTFMLSVTPERVAEIEENAPGFYSIADVLLLTDEKFRMPDDVAYADDKGHFVRELRELEQKYSFPSSEFWERMASGRCDGIPEDDLRRWERLVEALREE